MVYFQIISMKIMYMVCQKILRLKTNRLQFIKRLLGMRSNDFGKTLGLALINKYSNWDYPWNIYKTKIRIFTLQ